MILRFNVCPTVSNYAKRVTPVGQPQKGRITQLHITLLVPKPPLTFKIARRLTNTGNENGDEDRENMQRI